MTLKIAVCDNDKEFLETCLEHLRRAEYDVYAAESLEEAKHLLIHTWLHAVIIDIRLEDDLEEETSGLELAKDERFAEIPKIILTNHPHYQYVRDALGLRGNKLPPAVEFLKKSDGIEILIAAIDYVVSTHRAINWSLLTHWASQGMSHLSLAMQLDPLLNAAGLVERAEELEDLFGMLFAQSNQITIDRILWQRPGRVALVVFAFAEGMPDQQFVVTCGHKVAIRNEIANLESLGGANNLVGNLHPALQKHTLHYAANAYELPGSNLEAIRTFDELFQMGNLRETAAVLQTLTRSSLDFWHSKQRLAASGTDLGLLLQQRYGLDSFAAAAANLANCLDEISRAAEAVALATIARSDGTLHIRLPAGIAYAFPDPVRWLTQRRPAVDASPILLGPTLGDVRADTILVDDHGRTWLSDFGDLTLGPIVADFAALETTARFDLVEGENLLDLYEFERLLMLPDNLNDRIEAGPAALRKATAAIYQIRKLAADTCGDDFTNYREALAHQALHRILTYDTDIRLARRDIMPAVHACLSLGVILERLDQAAPDQPQAPAGLTIDEANRQVRVDGHAVNLSPMEFDAILYLWRRANQLCSRAELFQAVYENPYHPGRMYSDDAQLNMLIKRIRERIESDTGNPRYLITRRGEGYILYPDGKPNR